MSVESTAPSSQVLTFLASSPSVRSPSSGISFESSASVALRGKDQFPVSLTLSSLFWTSLGSFAILSVNESHSGGLVFQYMAEMLSPVSDSLPYEKKQGLVEGSR